MAILRTFLKATAITAVIIFLAFFVYANLQEPTPGEKIYMSDPTGISMLTISQDVQDIDAKVEQLPGVTSHTYVPENNTLVITYSKNQTNRISILSGLKASGINAVEKMIHSNKPQCPVHGYLDMFYKAKCALNLRK
ncbi:MAG: hypothetical protein KDC07_11405 [Chitinophagaceae bacterium]|nr:hypothetical protein [Chitinophagaceae bacterium]